MFIDTIDAHLPITVPISGLARGDGFLTPDGHIAVVCLPTNGDGVVTCFDMTSLASLTLAQAVQVIRYDLTLSVHDHEA